MIIKGTRQLGSFRRGINLYVPKRRIASAAPSGIPVATTNTINVVDTFGYNGTIALSKQNSILYSASVNFIYGTAYCEAISGDVDVTIAAIKLFKQSGYWFYRYEGLYDCDGNIFGTANDLASVLEVTSGIIPTTGWDPSLTITAA
jgi:hypothetical protein